MSAQPPFPQSRLQEIVQEACSSVLSKVSSYVHADTEQQNGEIINNILNNLVSVTNSVEASPSPHTFKYAVNSTIIQHLSDPSSSSTSTSAGTTSSHSLATQPHNSHTTQTLSPPDTRESTPAAIGEPAEALGANEADARTQDTPLAGGVSDERRSGASGTSTAPTKGRRGMHSATGAYWNNETDGMWSYKFEGGEAKGMDVVVCVYWIAV